MRAPDDAAPDAVRDRSLVRKTGVCLLNSLAYLVSVVRTVSSQDTVQLDTVLAKARRALQAGQGRLRPSIYALHDCLLRALDLGDGEAAQELLGCLKTTKYITSRLRLNVLTPSF